MKVNVFISLVVLLGACQEQEFLDQQPESEAWTIEWQSNQEKAFGTLYLSDNHEAQIIVDQPDNTFFSQPQNVHFEWNDTGKQFIFKRLDNGFKIAYDIKQRDKNNMVLAFQDDLIIKIYR